MAWEPLNGPSRTNRLGEGLDKARTPANFPPAKTVVAIFNSAKTVVAIYNAWDELVGVAMAAHSIPVRLTDRKLMVSVDDPSWATELRFFSSQLIERINQQVSGHPVDELVIRVRPQ